MIAQIQRDKSREIGSTGSGKRLKKINIQEGIRKSEAEKRVITEDNFNNNYLKTYLMLYDIILFDLLLYLLNIL